MAKRPPGQIYAAEPARRAAGDVFSWEELTPTTVKGKAELVSVFALTGSKRYAARDQIRDERAIVGRAAELDAKGALLDEALDGRGG